MILKECRDWADAFGDCFRGSNAGRLKKVLSALDPDGAGRWELGLDGGSGFKKIAFRYFGTEDDFSDFDGRAAAAFPGLPRAARHPEAGLPWLSFEWDRDETGGARRYGGAEGLSAGGGRIAYRRDLWTADVLSDDSLSAVFRDIAALCPIREFVSQWTVGPGGRREARDQWSLRFARPVPWPQFAGLGLAAPFTEDAALLAYLLLNRRVSELEFEGAALRVYCRA